MIIIKVLNSNDEEYEFEYNGDIQLTFDEHFLTINTYDIDKYNGNTWDKTTHDRFWLDEIVSITGFDRGEK
jgi:hypothetical protein